MPANATREISATVNDIVVGLTAPHYCQIYGSAIGSTALLPPVAICGVRKSWTADRCTAVAPELQALDATNSWEHWTGYEIFMDEEKKVLKVVYMELRHYTSAGTSTYRWGVDGRVERPATIAGRKKSEWMLWNVFVPLVCDIHGMCLRHTHISNGARRRW